MQQLLRGLATIVDGLSGMSNELADRHAGRRRPLPHHARPAVNAANTLCSFVVDSYRRQRDYLSTFLKIGTIFGLAVGILIVQPELQMPAVTRFVDGTGPVFAGGLFPFLFITIACGAVSGFHSLIASGTTPKMLYAEPQVRFIG